MSLSYTYRRRDSGDIQFYFCSNCGCVMHYVASFENENGNKLVDVDVQMSAPSPISKIPVRHFEGHDSFKELPADGRTVQDMWF